MRVALSDRTVLKGLALLKLFTLAKSQDSFGMIGT